MKFILLIVEILLQASKTADSSDERETFLKLLMRKIASTNVFERVVLLKGEPKIMVIGICVDLLSQTAK